MKSILNRINEQRYLISSTLFGILFMFPIMRNAVQSISLMTFLGVSVLFYHKTFLVRIKDRKLWKIYGILTGFFWFSVLTFLWTTDKVFFFNELRPSIAIALVPFVILFFHPTLTQKRKQLAIILFLVSLIIYAFLWFFHHVEGISIYQEIIAKESPLRDESFIQQLIYFKDNSFKVWIGGVSERGYELLGKNSFFSHSNYISSYYLFGYILAIYTLIKSRKILYNVIAVIALLFSLLFLFYLASKLNVFLFVVFSFGIAFYLLKTTKFRLAFIALIIAIGIFNKSKIMTTYAEIKQWELIEKTDNNLDEKIFMDYKRTKIYTCALEKLRTNYWFGVGLGDIQNYLDDCLMTQNHNNPNFDVTIEYNSHSQFLHFALVGGILNFLLFLGFFIYLFYSSYLQKNKLLFIFTFLIFASCFFENYLSRIYGVLFFILFITMLPNWSLISTEESINKQ
ncbi:O-antigen ligase family protein [Kordia sp.]|uniref:O-antigen ligase family protein n=1 Tax=Kordia sp. TaxID=1965332 RepID=UPI003D27733A